MNKQLQRIVLYLLIITSCGLAHSQNEEQQPLAQILEQLEKRYDVKFSYETKTIESFTVTPIYSELSLKQALNLLRLTTQLDYKE